MAERPGARLMAGRTITNRQLRKWGAMTGSGLIVAGCLVFLWRGHGWGRIPLGLGALFAVLGLTTLPPARLVFRLWHALIDGLFWVWTRVALFLTYMIAVTPLSLIGRLIGRDRMQTRFPGNQESYWVDHKKDDRPGRYRRQF